MESTDSPWLGDAVSLVDAFRRKERSPLEELRASLAAIEKSSLNAFSFVDAEGAIERAKSRKHCALFFARAREYSVQKQPIVYLRR